MASKAIATEYLIQMLLDLADSMESDFVLDLYGVTAHELEAAAERLRELHD